MQWTGLALLLLVGVGIISTGLPAAVVLIAVAAFGATFGVVTGAIDVAILGALPSRLINLFENDLLQALPLYVTMGLLLDRLPVADALYRAGNAILPRRPSAPLVSGMMLGALLGPMNGSVGASVLGLSRVVSPRLAAEGLPAPNRHAIVAVASTLGVLVPPSLVLILLSDAMLSAHTMAVTATGRSDRVVNTQDIFHAALVPGGIFLALCLALSWIVGRSATRLPDRERLTAGQAWLAAVALASLIALLGGVAFGYFYAVEAAAMSPPGIDDTILPTRSAVPSSLRTSVNVVAASSKANSAPVRAMASASSLFSAAPRRRPVARPAASSAKAPIAAASTA